jgi:hypothetical protein
MNHLLLAYNGNHIFNLDVYPVLQSSILFYTHTPLTGKLLAPVSCTVLKEKEKASLSWHQLFSAPPHPK